MLSEDFVWQAKTIFVWVTGKDSRQFGIVRGKVEGEGEREENPPKRSLSTFVFLPCLLASLCANAGRV